MSSSAFETPHDLLSAAGFKFQDPRIMLVTLGVVFFLVTYIIPPQSLFNFFAPMICAGVLFAGSTWLHSHWNAKRILRGDLQKERATLLEGMSSLKKSKLGPSPGAVGAASSNYDRRYAPLLKGSSGNGVRFSDLMISDGADPVEEFLNGAEDGSEREAPRRLRSRGEKRVLYTGRRKGAKTRSATAENESKAANEQKQTKQK